MTTAATSDPRIAEMEVTDDEIIARLLDGRTVSVPLVWSWCLSEATPEQRANFEIIGDGDGAQLARYRRGHQRERDAERRACTPAKAGNRRVGSA